jgi:NADH dehydrogenase (ubiquinone) 1 beta subcomplex subunit 7
MTVAETLKDTAESIKESVGLGHGHSAPSKRAFRLDHRAPPSDH